jgi:hypothetical protein
MGDYVSGLKESGIERRNLRTFVVASALAGLVSFLLVKTGLGMFGKFRGWFS